MLEQSLADIPRGKIATIVTHLEMTSRAPARPDFAGHGSIHVRRAEQPDVTWYRDLYTRVGEDWLWFSRLQMPHAALEAIIRHPDVEVYALIRGGTDTGLLELDFRVPGACELAFFGLTPTGIGTGAGRLLMNTAIAQAWARPIQRFHVHTCTLDHPNALAFYRRSGFTPVRQQFELVDDPRLAGLLPETAAPHVPIFR